MSGVEMVTLGLLFSLHVDISEIRRGGIENMTNWQLIRNLAQSICAAILTVIGAISYLVGY